MSGAVYGRTPNIGLGLLEFNFPNWADDANDNSSIIDGVMSVIGVSVKGAWLNNTQYNPGDLVIDTVGNYLLRCLVQHTSAPTGTFADERAAHPDYWQAASTSLHARGQWQTGVTYYTNDIVYRDANQYSWGLVTHQFVGGTSYDADVFAGNIVVITNTEQVVIDATAAKNAAQTSATNAATSAANAATSASGASISAIAADESADAALISQTAAASSASSAGTSSVSAATSASAAAVSANNAFISESNASNSAASASASLAAMLPDAAADSRTYGRRNNAWQEVASTSLPEAPFTGIVYGRKSGAWVDAASGSTAASSTYIGDGPPASPVDGQLWWESDTGALFIWFNDGNTSQWVLATPASGPPGQPGPPGGLGEAPTDGKTYARRSSAWVDDWASPTFTGDPKAPTPLTADNDTSIATTAFVKAQGYITDAVSDSTQYARYNGGWAQVIATSLGTLFAYTFAVTTTAPPASGTIRLNNATQTAATTMWIHYTNGSSVNIKNYFINRVKVGDTFYLQDKNDATKWQLYEMTGAFTDNGTYATVPVTWVAGGSALLAQAIIVSREAAGGVPPVDDVIGGIITISNTAPSTPAVNDVWIDTT